MQARPGQVEPNELELAVLERIAHDEPELAHALGTLHVLSREYTGVGCFTRFLCSEDAGPRREVGLRTEIRVPGLEHGLGAVLYMRGARPEELELFAYGDERWDGVHDGFSIDDERA